MAVKCDSLKSPPIWSTINMQPNIHKIFRNSILLSTFILRYCHRWLRFCYDMCDMNIHSNKMKKKNADMADTYHMYAVLFVFLNI